MGHTPSRTSSTEDRNFPCCLEEIPSNKTIFKMFTMVFSYVSVSAVRLAAGLYFILTFMFLFAFAVIAAFSTPDRRKSFMFAEIVKAAAMFIFAC